MKKVTILAYFILSVEIAYSQNSTDSNKIPIKKSDQTGTMFYDQYEGRHTLSVEKSTATKLRLNTGAGDLKVKRIDGNAVKVKATIFVMASSYKKAAQYMDADLELTLKNRGTYLELNSYFDYKRKSSGSVNPFDFIKSPARGIDLIVYVPKGLNLEIHDNSGDLELLGLDNNIVLEDGSGDIVVRDCRGELSIEDGSGDIVLSNHNTAQKPAKMSINDHSGDIRIEDVAGRLKVDDDSGDILIEGVEGDLLVQDDSGDVRVRDVHGDFKIRDTAGDINTRRIRGSASYDDGSGDIYISDITKDVNILEAGPGDVSIRNVSGVVSGDLGRRN